MSEKVTEERGRRKVRQGLVVSNKMDKTVVVKIERRMQHPLYGKTVLRTGKFKAHDEMGCDIGDTVEVMETRPLSKEKRWRERDQPAEKEQKGRPFNGIESRPASHAERKHRACSRHSTPKKRSHHGFHDRRPGSNDSEPQGGVRRTFGQSSIRPVTAM